MTDLTPQALRPIPPDLIFETQSHLGYTAAVWNAEGADARVQIKKGDDVVREFLYPAYRVYNIAAHFTDIIDDLLAKRHMDQHAL